MEILEVVCVWLAEITTFLASFSAFVYGIRNFFKKGKAVYLQLVTLGMGCYAMGCIYHLFQMITYDEVVEGFTASYLGKMGFFLFLFTANFGQIDGLLDDGTPQIKKSRILGFLAPLVAGILYIPCAVVEMPLSTKVTYALVWICAFLSLYYNFKHAIIKDLGFGFAKAIRPYNISATILTFTELILLVCWVNYDIAYGSVIIAGISVLFSVMCIVTMIKLKKGVEEWTI